MLNNIIKLVKNVLGNDIYAVGGCVRDYIMGLTPKDYDFCTPISPDEIEQKVKDAGRKSYAVGKKFGTIGFKICYEGKWIHVEVTTFRIEEYTNSRKPVVTYTDNLFYDLNRRDFTINAIAYDGDKYYDYFGGISDIKEKRIKVVGDVVERFKEDPLRMLRYARFIAQFELEYDIDTINVIKSISSKILSVSKERWVVELDKILIGKAVNIGMKVLEDTHVLKYILPELNINIEFTQTNNINAAWTQVFLSLHEEKVICYEMAVGICYRLKFSKERTNNVLNMLMSK